MVSWPKSQEICPKGKVCETKERMIIYALRTPGFVIWIGGVIEEKWRVWNELVCRLLV